MPYVTRRKRTKSDEEEFDYWCDQLAAQTNITVHEDDDCPQPTGLLDATGNEICRVRDRLPMGFRAK